VRVVIQRVDWASVSVDKRRIAAIGPGFLLLVGVAGGDTEAIARKMAGKCADLRLFADESGRFERSAAEAGMEALVVSQFTLLADTRRGRRPSFTGAAAPEVAEPLVDAFADELRARGLPVATGRFGAMMQVELVNNGPVTIILDSDELERPRRGA
jgi:D-tyrosyl-tRNA(Tyr) deacylase